MPSFSVADEQYMRRALALAARGLGRVEPNPMVGCVLVKNGRVIGEGWHRRFGGPHAEVNALRACRTSPRGATAYVTLEPCAHYGKTPPCADALIAAGVSRVVAPIADPNPAVAGRGFHKLRAAGIQVDTGLLANDAAQLMAPFLKHTTTGRPWVILKWAQSLDGKLAARTGDSKWITDDQCRAHAHRTRGRVDAIVVGIRTVLADDPLLTCRSGRPRRIARRVVLDAHLRIPVTAHLVRTARQFPTWVFCGPNVAPRRAKALADLGCVVHRAPLARGRGDRDFVNLAHVLDALAADGCTNVLVEGGSTVLGHFFDERLADEFHIYLGPVLIGGAAAPGPLGGHGVAAMSKALCLTTEAAPADFQVRRLGTGLLIQARPPLPDFTTPAKRPRRRRSQP